ncbi:hypothetical protein BT63DRAFT_426711 [Microthyrium microscopicum]|uniref:Uncharacterized protein n=1 Tax=Microthyrium microscopicum TaxID=703497 RepID=A0A6A6U9R2_9PEZI|nr:hypothetical protein BT63DRAFT_426711 [Microthyrium microscopicum]
MATDEITRFENKLLTPKPGVATHDLEWHRISAEEEHYEHEERWFTHPVIIHSASSPTDLDRHVWARAHWQNGTNWRLGSPAPDDVRPFCHKDCAFYNNKKAWSDQRPELYKAIYEEWLPHRARDRSFYDGNFFGKPLKIDEDDKVWPLEDFVSFHQALCGSLAAVELPSISYHPRFPPSQSGRMMRTFEMRETFSYVFIVLDGEWKEDGVILVWMNGAYAAKHGCVEDGDVRLLANDELLGEARAFRCPLKRAMQLVVSTDPNRAKKRRVWSHCFDKFMGDSEFDGAGDSIASNDASL